MSSGLLDTLFKFLEKALNYLKKIHRDLILIQVSYCP